jgi:hypothetical protein
MRQTIAQRKALRRLTWAGKKADPNCCRSYRWLGITWACAILVCALVVAL